MHSSAKFLIHQFNGSSPLELLPQSTQVKYLKVYLDGLNTKTIIEEPQYFDRDYLSEFSNFYSTSASGYSNLCRRFHYFNQEITRKDFEDFCGGHKTSIEKIQTSYLGFSVIRPINAVLGRTVLSWYEDKHKGTHPRITKPSRRYQVHIAGIPLFVEGLAWQQQDQGVSACATVSVWSALHSSAFDEHHGIPTTAEITLAAHKKISFGARVFPSYGLSIEQLKESIKEFGLTPLIQPIRNPTDTPERFIAACASFIRSGYPVIAIGFLFCDQQPIGGHAICIVGFRESSSKKEIDGIEFQDAGCDTLYLHDDNLGPNVRVKVSLGIDPQNNGLSIIELQPSPPTDEYGSIKHDDPIPKHYSFRPTELLIAVNNDLRTSADHLNKKGISLGTTLQKIVSMIANDQKQTVPQLSVSTRFVKLSEYLMDELERMFSNNRAILSKIRVSILEDVRPLSLHLGVVRVGQGSTPLLDVLYDTTDSDLNHPIFAHIVMDKNFSNLLSEMHKAQILNLGIRVEAY